MKPPEIMGGGGGPDTLMRGNMRLAGNGRRRGEGIWVDRFLRRPHLQINDQRRRRLHPPSVAETRRLLDIPFYFCLPQTRFIALALAHDFNDV